MNRRELLKKLGLGTGIVTLTPVTLSLFQSCQNDLDWDPVFFNKDEIGFLETLCELILPSSDILPGSKDLDLVRFIDLYAFNVLDDGSKSFLTKTFNSFKNEYFEESDNSNINRIDKTSISKLLNFYLEENKVKHDIWMNDYMESSKSFSYMFLFSVRELLINAFRTNQYIATNVLVYKPIPMEQKGCVDLKSATNGKAWAID